MKREELEKEAREYLAEHSKYSEIFGEFFVAVDTLTAMLDFSEPREKRIAELEKENAELKGLKDVATLIRANNDTVTTLMQLNNMLVSKTQQLTKAKKLLQFVSEYQDMTCYADELKEIEQFLKETE